MVFKVLKWKVRLFLNREQQFREEFGVSFPKGKKERKEIEERVRLSLATACEKKFSFSKEFDEILERWSASHPLSKEEFAQAKKLKREKHSLKREIQRKGFLLLMAGYNRRFVVSIVGEALETSY